MAYTPPSGIIVDLNFEGEYTPPLSGITVDLWFAFDGLTNTLECSDRIAFDDIVSSRSFFSLVLSDAITFNDILNQPQLTLFLSDEIRFTDLLLTKDIIVKWRARTKEILRGAGGLPYGDIGYGAKNASDISGYIIEVWNKTTGLLKRSTEIVLTDLENPDYEYAYSRTMNITDNGAYTTNLTFKIYQVSSNGVPSEVKQISLT